MRFWVRGKSRSLQLPNAIRGGSDRKPESTAQLLNNQLSTTSFSQISADLFTGRAQAHRRGGRKLG
jgi:hypothetical protein